MSEPLDVAYVATRVRAEIEAVFEAAETPEGVMMEGAAWFVRAMSAS